MNLRGTLILLGLALITITLLVFLQPKQEHPSREPLFHGDPSQVTRIVMVDGNESRSLTLHDHQWEIDTTPPDQADKEEVMSLLGAALEVKPLDILIPEELKNQLSLPKLGLQDPKSSLLLHYKNSPDQILYFGNEAVGEKRLFARFSSQKEVIIIPSTLADIAFRPNDLFRNHHLTALALDSIKKITLSQKLGEMCIERQGEQWNMKEPTIALVSSNALNSWITPLLEAPILERISNDQGNLAAYDLEEPRATITFFPESSDKPVTLSLGKSVEQKNNKEALSPAIYIRSSERHAIFTIPAALEKTFLISPDMLREHQLCTINLDTVDRIEAIKSNTALKLHRQPENHENWVTEEEHPSIISGSEIQKMVSTLEQVMVTSFEIATPTKLQAAGIEPASKAAMTLRFIAHLSENTPDENAGDFPIKEICFGTPSVDNTLFARIDHNPEIVQIPASTVTTALNCLQLVQK
ncbi:MAG: DUF4340 domain-containing protein [Chthoniobacterales bacterium]|nr:DUF4340 domain-containing protein [Chthoniobacterales bacterium]